MLAILVVFLPLAAAVVAGFFGRAIGDRASQIVTCGALLLSAALGIVLFRDILGQNEARIVHLASWIVAGGVDVDWAIRLDTLSGVMILVVTIVSAMVHVYSVGYMAHDAGIPRFFAYLSLFTFFMLMLATSNNFVQLFFGWEGVGLASYLLIGFWYDRKSANDAAIKAFVVNRVGDFGFALGIFAVFVIFGSLDLDTVFQKVPGTVALTMDFLGWRVPALTLACILLFIGAMGKSAQLGLHTWLPDAMEGPTPVSALIHAATMVTAGVFMVARLSPMFEYSPTALAVVGVVGGTTAVFAASIGMAQNDIKRVIAYSTCSQLGYMFFAAGVSAYAASMFHLFTHAFFKALLFLGAGSVIHAMSAEQDMRRMGGIARRIPITYVLMWIGSLSLAGIPIFAGYYSKDTILEAAWASGTAVGRYSFCLGVFTAFLTAFYSWRLLILTFNGKPRADAETMAHVHESPWVMLIPLFVLAAGAVCAGFLAEPYFVGTEQAGFWKHAILVLPQHDSIAASHGVGERTLPELIAYLPLIAGVLGIATAYWTYWWQPDLPSEIAARFRALYLFLYNKWYFDELYDWLFVRGAFALGQGLWKSGDETVIDGLGPDGIAAATRDLARQASRLQTGYVYHYAFAMLIGVVALITWYLLPR
ncbi:MAG: NADH-quinone oxidoreductase subunit L [Alphaproteobacteria bacterium]|nr:NADH-quinone oxidoreductase subunit L [Alphaproteobacteria bacterium]